MRDGFSTTRKDTPPFSSHQLTIHNFLVSLVPQTPLNLDDARRVVGRFVTYYVEVRLHSAIGYVTPRDMLEGRAEKIHAERDRKLEEARERRRLARQRMAA
jgi:hypothetical protein